MTRDTDDPAKPKTSVPKTGEHVDMKPGSPPRPASEPDGAGGSNSGQTLTDPATGTPNH